jgi:hypothetical protein
MVVKKIIQMNFYDDNVDEYVKEFSRKNKIDYERVYGMDIHDLSNPYKDKGNILYIEFNQMVQLLGKKTALYSKDGKTFRVEFNDYAGDKIGGNFVIKGAYKYTNILGSGEIAYSLKEIKY